MNENEQSPRVKPVEAGKSPAVREERGGRGGAAREAPAAGGKPAGTVSGAEETRFRSERIRSDREARADRRAEQSQG